ncbi:MAG TPA: hypothetical protein VNR00_05315 [Opitutus sp.]|nr:hypothetical protein [Opitutus sp.]
MKTVRFADVVARSGEPEVHLPWLPPKQDKTFQRVVKAQRVMTIHQENVGTKKDYGLVGFEEQPHAQYLVFPKSLAAFEGRRVIGINYHLLAEGSRPAAKPARGTAAKPEKKTPVKKAKPKTEKRVAPENVVPFASEPAEKNETTPAPEPVKERTARTSLDRRAIAEIKRAMKELRAGKAVPAYERLARLVEDSE